MRVREVMNKLYNYTPDGYCGDEDNGQTSAWYVFSALGFYPVTPGTGEYVLGAPLFREALITLENGKTLAISAAGNNERNIYVRKVLLNGKEINVNFVTHEQLNRGGTLTYEMTSEPYRTRGATKDAYPYSMSR